MPLSLWGCVALGGSSLCVRESRPRARQYQATRDDDKDDGIIIISLPKALLRQQSRYARSAKSKEFAALPNVAAVKPWGGAAAAGSGGAFLALSLYFDKLLLRIL
jgi:hypothetical protein